MFKNYWLGLLILVIIFHIFFSFYYSSEIINQNNLYSKNQIKIIQLKNEKQNLEIERDKLFSLNYINQKLPDFFLSPIKQNIDLNNP